MVKFYTEEEALSESLKYFNGDELAANVWIKKYCLRDNTNKLLEKSPTDMHWRMANEFARIEKNKFKNPLTKEEIFGYFDKFEHICPQGSPMSAIGNTHQLESTGNCYVVNSPYDSYGGILYTDQQLVQLMKRRCGVGLDISTLRPKGEVVLNAAKTTDGIGVFMERFSNTCREVAQNGRSGAEIILLSVNHPEIMTFINIKKDKTKITGANISVKITDDFMKAVKNDDDFILKWPVDVKHQHSTIKVSAKVIWNNIINNVWDGGEPGLLFWDTAIKNSLSNQYGVKDPNFYDIACNPCFAGSEYLLTDTGYKKFGELYKTKESNTVICDNRISYVDEGKENPENWKINLDNTGTIIRQASKVFLTQKNANLVKVETDLGMDVICTPDHHFATTIGMIEAQNLLKFKNTEILVPLPDCDFTIVNQLPETKNEKVALLIGLITGDGNFCKQQVHIDFWGDDAERISNICKKIINELYVEYYPEIQKTSKNGWNNRDMSPYYISKSDKLKKIRITSTWLKKFFELYYNFGKETKLIVPKIIMENCRTKMGLYYLAGFYYADGTVNISIKKHSVSIRLSQSDENILKQVQLMLLSNGILTKTYLRRKAHRKEIKGKIYNIKKQYELITLNSSYYEFAKNVGFIQHPQKETKIFNYINQKHKNYKKLSCTTFAKNIIPLEKKEDVYCIKEDIGRNVIVNGCSVRRCGEIIMGIDSCRLMVLNLWGYIENPFTTAAEFNYDKFIKHTIIAQRLMDDLIDLEIEHITRIIKKVEIDPEPNFIKNVETEMWKTFLNNCKNGRRTGLGLTAIGDVLAALNIRYGSKESIVIVDKIYQTLAIASMKSSCLIAKELGTFPLYDATLEKNNVYLNRLFEVSTEVKELHEKYGRRNISLTTSSPTGTLSLLTQTTSGIEPVFSVEYKRRRKIMSNENIKPTFIDKMGDNWTDYNVYHHKYALWSKISGKIKFEDSPYYKTTANDVDWESSVDIQATAQKWISHSISKTVNIPQTATKELIEKIYIRAYEKGCKGITIYRDKSRDGVLLNNETNIKEIPKILKIEAPKRPKELPCDIYHIKITKKLDKVRTFDYMVMVGLYNSSPYEIFCMENGQYKGKSVKGIITKEAKGQYHLTMDDSMVIKNVTKNTTDSEDALTRMVSTALRHGVAIEFIVDQLSKVEGADLFAFSKSLARALKKYIKEGAKSGENCEKCGAKLVFENGCYVCKGCGMSKC